MWFHLQNIVVDFVAVVSCYAVICYVMFCCGELLWAILRRLTESVKRMGENQVTVQKRTKAFSDQ